ncbi:DUF3237 domain-containing protein [Cryobacterium melibiosiphilum]|uniref:hypothetical protein n=1 Tax=Cryobacterium melibiosiphilum TaxID=995039 RepID=UPI0038990F26
MRSGTPEDIQKLVRGESVDPARMYFRCSIRLDAAGQRRSWLRSKIIIETDERFTNSVRLKLFNVE